uniref:Uncharacterized protein n=1 Tax=Mola mola TaxID=94237 RepID=A0A3Q3XHI3_MOLML
MFQTPYKVFCVYNFLLPRTYIYCIPFGGKLYLAVKLSSGKAPCFSTPPCGKNAAAHTFTRAESVLCCCLLSSDVRLMRRPESAQLLLLSFLSPTPTHI